MAEGNHGAIDAFIMPGNEDSTQDLYQPVFLNYTAITNLLSKSGSDYNISPRKTYCGTNMFKI